RRCAGDVHRAWAGATRQEGQASGLREETLFSGILGHLSPTLELQFLQDIMDMALHRREFYPQTHRNVFIAESRLNQRHDLALPTGEGHQAEHLQALPGACPFRNPGEEQPGDTRGTKGLTYGHRLNVIEEIR